MNDEEWVADLYKKNAARMYKVASRRLGTQEGAEDLVQEAFVALISKIDAVKAHPNPSGWLMKALKYLILQKIELEQKRLDNEVQLKDTLYMEAPMGYQIPLREMLPPGLSSYEQDMLIWRFEDQLSYEEIARRLNIKILTCRTQFFRIRKRYQKLAQKDNVFLEIM